MFACVDGKAEKRGQWGPGKRAKNGQLTLSIGPAGAEVCLLVQKAAVPSKRVIFTLVSTTHALNIIYMLVILCI
jgi:hypothetical protein